MRGDIIDVYAVNYPDPLRLEFFGDEMESIRFFDATDQKSKETAKSVRILPISLESQPEEATYTLLDYVGDGVIVWDEPNRVRENLKKLFKESDDYKGLVCPWQKAVSQPRGTQVVLSLLAQSVPDMTIDSSASFAVKMMASFQKQFNLLADELQHWQQNDNTVLFVLGSKERTATLTSWLKKQQQQVLPYDDDVPLQAKGVYIADGEIRNGYELPYAKLVIISERDIYGMQKHRLRHHAAKGQEINVFTDLKPGDYVVHESHGIGRYDGIKTIELDGVHKDYLEIHYADKDILYVPTDQLNLLQRYIGNEGNTPKLHKMGGNDWQKARKKAQKL